MVTMAFIIIIVITSMPAVASSLLLSVVLGVEVVHIDLVMIVRDHRLLDRGQYLGEGLGHGWLDVWGEDNVELYQESPLLERVSVIRHSFSLNLLHISGLDNFPSHSLDDQCSLVKRFDCFLHACESLRECDVHLHDQVLSTSLERVVSLLVEDNDDVAGLEAGLLVALAGEGDLLTVGHALVHLDLENLPLTVDFSSIALFASQLGINSLSLAMTFLTHGLDLLHHAGPELLDPDLHPAAATVGALLHRARLAAHTLARVADDILLEGELPGGPVVHVLQGH